MNDRYFYQVQTPYVLIPQEIPVYMTFQQIQARSAIVPDQTHASDGWYLVTEHSRNSSLILDQGEVFGLTQIPEPTLLAKLKSWPPPSEETALEPKKPNMTLCQFTELSVQSDPAFKSLTQLTRAEFAQQLTQLSLHHPRRGRQVRFEIQDALYLYALHRQGHYTYAQLAHCYHWSITQVYSAVQWVKKQLLLAHIS